MIKEKQIGSISMMKFWMTIKGNSSLKFWPPVKLANIVKRKDLDFALLNCEIIEAMWRQLIGSDGAE